jgi:hypothetical protein
MLVGCSDSQNTFRNTILLLSIPHYALLVPNVIWSTHLQLSQRPCHGLCELDLLSRLLHGHEAREQRHQLVLVQVAQHPIEHKLSGHKLVACIHLAGSSPLEEDNLCKCCERVVSQ